MTLIDFKKDDSLLYVGDAIYRTAEESALMIRETLAKAKRMKRKLTVLRQLLIEAKSHCEEIMEVLNAYPGNG